MGRWLVGAIAGGWVGLAFGGCGQWSEFTCQSDDQCVAEQAGICQPDGHCSFPADDCPSGQRYGEHGGSFAGQCVDTGSEAETTQNAGTTTTSGTTDESGEPVLTTTTSPSTSDESTSLPMTTGDASSGGDSSSTGEPVDPDLVLWLELEDPPRAGVLDSSPFMSHGVCRSPACPELARGIVGQGAGFDGVDDVIAVPHAPSLETTEGLTVAAWIYVAEPPVGHQAVLTKPVGLTTANSWELFFWSGSIGFGMSSGGAYSGVDLPWAFEGGQWVHLAGTWDGATIKLWIDGGAVGSIDAPTSEFDDHPVLVGADDDHEGLIGHFLGTIDDVRVYRRALTAEELAALASG